jgi:hypothetical protein
MTTVRYARVKSTITDENSDDNVNQLETIDSEEEDEEDVLPGTPVKSSQRHADPNVMIKNSVERRSLIRTVLWIGLLILCYFILSIGLTFYQRWLLKVIEKTQNDEKLFSIYFRVFLKKTTGKIPQNLRNYIFCKFPFKSKIF